MTKQRNLDVQTPGGQIAGADDAQMGADEAKTTEAEAPKAKATVDRPSRARYAQMGADEVDAKTLTAAVLTRDGWLAPDQSGQKGKE